MPFAEEPNDDQPEKQSKATTSRNSGTTGNGSTKSTSRNSGGASNFSTAAGGNRHSVQHINSRSISTSHRGINSNNSFRNNIDNKKIQASLDGCNLSSTSNFMGSHIEAEEIGGRNNDFDGTKIDDECFVCGHGGHLLLCDFPHCIRAYHQVILEYLFLDVARVIWFFLL